MEARSTAPPPEELLHPAAWPGLSAGCGQGEAPAVQGGVTGGLGLHLQQGGGHYSQLKLHFYLIEVLLQLSHPV